MKIMDQMAYQDELSKSYNAYASKKQKNSDNADDQLYNKMMSSPIERKEKLAKYEKMI